MTSPLLDKLTEQHGFTLLAADNYTEFVAAHEYVVLFLANNPVQFPESNDVAVILPELLKTFQQPVQAALVSSEANFERQLQTQFRFTRWPSMVFLKQGEYLGTISGILNWNEYLSESLAILNAPVSQPPAFDLEKVCPTSTSH